MNYLIGELLLTMLRRDAEHLVAELVERMHDLAEIAVGKVMELDEQLREEQRRPKNVVEHRPLAAFDVDLQQVDVRVAEIVHDRLEPRRAERLDVLHYCALKKVRSVFGAAVVLIHRDFAIDLGQRNVHVVQTGRQTFEALRRDDPVFGERRRIKRIHVLQRQLVNQIQLETNILFLCVNSIYT